MLLKWKYEASDPVGERIKEGLYHGSYRNEYH